jgi:hypothetical protein
MKFLDTVPQFAQGRWFYLILVAILLIGLILRTLFITADAPIGFTSSQDVSTDPFAYTYFAENKVDYGDANPLKDNRWVVYEKSTQTVVAYIVYSILGTGRAEGNLAAVLMNLCAILLVALGLKNFGSRLGALLFALLASVNFTLTVFARIPFLEASQNLWLSASFFLFSMGEQRRIWYAPAGAATAMAAFFGKMVALYAIGLYLAVWIFKYLTAASSTEPPTEVNRKSIIKNAIYFYGAYAIIAVFWLFFTYLPSSDQVSAYFHEQGRGLYGAPKALEDLSSFLWQAESLLWDSKYFYRLPVISILAAVAGAILVLYLFRSLRSRRFEAPSQICWTLVLIWYVLAYSVLFPFNYRPLRYQTTLMFPMMAMAGMLLALPFDFAGRRKTKPEKKGKRQSRLLWAIPSSLWLAPFLCALYLTVAGSRQTVQAVMGDIYVYTFAFVAAGIVLAVGAQWIFRDAFAFRRVAQFASLSLIFAIVVVEAIGFMSWFGARQYSLVAADHDIGAIVAEDAVLSGSYATALTQENKLKCVHHQFGVVNPDPNFFSKFPITHLVIDQGNEERARKDYPELMSNAKVVTDYVIRGFPVKLFRISAVSPNTDARSYAPTNFEMAMEHATQGATDSAVVYAERFAGSGQKSFSAETFLASLYSERKEFSKAIDHARSAVQYSCNDPYSAYWLAGAFLNAASDPHNPSYLDSALVYLRFAQRGLPGNKNIADLIDRVTRATR